MYQTQDIGYLTSNLVIKWVSNHSPVNKAIRTRIRYDLWRQWSSKCSERTRKSFGRNCPSDGMNPWTSMTIVFWRANKAKLGILLGFYPTYALECSALNHFARENPRITQLRMNGATITRHQPKMPCVPNKMANAGSSNLPWRPVLKAEKKINKVTGMVLRTRYLELIYFEPFYQYLF